MKLKKGTVVIDLTKSEEHLWRNVHKKNRWSVQKARKLGVRIVEGRSMDYDGCYSLYLDTCKTNLMAPGPKYPLFSSGRLFLALKGKDLLAFSVVREKNKKAFLRFNSSDYRYRELQANPLLYWETLLIYKQKGYINFDLGGVDLHAAYRRGNDRFKIRWGGNIIEREENISFIEYGWWIWFRHNNFLRKIKYYMQMLFRGGA